MITNKELLSRLKHHWYCTFSVKTAGNLVTSLKYVGVIKSIVCSGPYPHNARLDDEPKDSNCSNLFAISPTVKDTHNLSIQTTIYVVHSTIVNLLLCAALWAFMKFITFIHLRKRRYDHELMKIGQNIKLLYNEIVSRTLSEA